MEIILETVQHFFIEKMEHPLFLLIILMTVIWSSGRLFSAIKLPHILGEICAGVLLGPAFLGIVHETELVKVLAELGIFFMMFHAGLDTDLRDLIKGSRHSFIAALGSTLLIVCIIFLFSFSVQANIFDGNKVAVLFTGLVLSAASFPIITRILRHLKIRKTQLGVSIISGSIVSELMAFILISVLISIYADGQSDFSSIISILVDTIAFFLGTVILGKIVLPWFSPILNRPGSKGFTFSLIVALFFALFAEAIGLHFVLGAYLGGIFTREEITNEKIYNKIEDRYFCFAYSFLGPIFFATVGIELSGHLANLDWLMIILLSTLVVIGQIAGASLIQKLLAKKSWHYSLSFGAALSGRGAMDIVLASIGLSVGIISQQLFSLIVGASILLMFCSPFIAKFFLEEKEKNIQ